MSILTVNLFAMTLIMWIAARIYLFPRLGQLSPRAVLVPILLFHATRHLGLMFLAPGAVYPGLPSEFALPAALGDLIAATLALASLLALTKRWAMAIVLLWVFSIEGIVDLLAAITLATLHEADKFMGAAYWIPALWVPALLVTHAIVIILLWQHGYGMLAEQKVG
jgi:hypothetical protein